MSQTRQISAEQCTCVGCKAWRAAQALEPPMEVLNIPRVPLELIASHHDGQEIYIQELRGKVFLSYKRNRYGVGAIARGQSGRQEYQGPLVPGPWAFANKLGITISGSDAMRKLEAEERKTDIPVQPGTLLRIDAVVYRVVMGPHDEIALHAVQTREV